MAVSLGVFWVGESVGMCAVLGVVGVLLIIGIS